MGNAGDQLFLPPPSVPHNFRLLPPPILPLLTLMFPPPSLARFPFPFSLALGLVSGFFWSPSVCSDPPSTSCPPLPPIPTDFCLHLLTIRSNTEIFYYGEVRLTRPRFGFQVFFPGVSKFCLPPYPPPPPFRVLSVTPILSLSSLRALSSALGSCQSGPGAASVLHCCPILFPSR